MSNLNFIKKWEVIDLVELCNEIASGNRKHPVMKELDYEVQERSKGNDSVIFDSIGEDENIPIINEYLLECGFNNGDNIVFWVSW